MKTYYVPHFEGVVETATPVFPELRAAKDWLDRRLDTHPHHDPVLARVQLAPQDVVAAQGGPQLSQRWRYPPAQLAHAAWQIAVCGPRWLPTERTIANCYGATKHALTDLWHAELAPSDRGQLPTPKQARAAGQFMRDHAVMLAHANAHLSVCAAVGDNLLSRRGDDVLPCPHPSKIPPTTMKPPSIVAFVTDNDFLVPWWGDGLATGARLGAAAGLQTVWRQLGHLPAGLKEHAREAVAAWGDPTLAGRAAARQVTAGVRTEYPAPVWPPVGAPSRGWAAAYGSPPTSATPNSRPEPASQITTPTSARRR